MIAAFKVSYTHPDTGQKVEQVVAFNDGANKHLGENWTDDPNQVAQQCRHAIVKASDGKLDMTIDVEVVEKLGAVYDGDYLVADLSRYKRPGDDKVDEQRNQV